MQEIEIENTSSQANDTAELLEALKLLENMAVAWAANYQTKFGLKEFHRRHANALARVRAAVGKIEGKL